MHIFSNRFWLAADRPGLESKRAIKEAMVVASADVRIGADRYQHLIELALGQLSELERRVIYLRFWKTLTIAEVADRLNMSWDGADFLIDQAVKKIHAWLIRREKKRMDAA